MITQPTAVVRQMTDEQKRVLKMALEKALGGNTSDPPNGDEGKGLIMKVMNLPAWPSDGFHILAREIVYCAIADEWPHH